MPIEMFCSGCGKRMRAPDTAGGKQVRCPECKTVSVVPMPAGQHHEPPPENNPPAYPPSYPPAAPPSPFGDIGGLMDEAAGHDYSMSVNLPPVPPPQREMSPYRAPRAAPARKRRRDDDDELTGAEIFLAVCCSGIGCIMGIIFLLQGKSSKGGKMIAISMCMQVFWVLVRGVLMVVAQQAGQ